MSSCFRTQRLAPEYLPRALLLNDSTNGFSQGWRDLSPPSQDRVPDVLPMRLKCSTPRDLTGAPAGMIVRAGSARRSPVGVRDADRAVDRGEHGLRLRDRECERRLDPG
jgi:hypothetical protein